MARREALMNQDINMATISGYHCGDFAKRYYFTSDRKVTLDEYGNRPDGKPLMGYGLEVETECKGITNSVVLAEVFDKIIFAKFPADLWKLERDASLGGDSSAECITQIMTKDRIRNLYPQFKAMFNSYFPSFKISASSTGNCGMHVNISNACFGKKQEVIDESIKKLLYFVNHHYETCLVLFKRSSRNLTYCGKMGEYDDKYNCKNASLYNMPASHFNCFNASHYPQGRIELRIVGGQKDYWSFRNTMETVFFLVDRMHSVSWKDLDNLSKVFEGCNQYVYKRLEDVQEMGYISAHEMANIYSTVKEETLLG